MYRTNNDIENDEMRNLSKTPLNAALNRDLSLEITNNNRSKSETPSKNLNGVGAGKRKTLKIYIYDG